MDKKRKHTWTPASALAYIERVGIGAAPHGLKYCSAVDYIRKLTAKAIVKKAGEN